MCKNDDDHYEDLLIEDPDYYDDDSWDEVWVEDEYGYEDD